MKFILHLTFQLKLMLRSVGKHGLYINYSKEKCYDCNSLICLPVYDYKKTKHDCITMQLMFYRIVCLDTEELMAPSLVGSVSHADVLAILTPVMILLASAM